METVKQNVCDKCGAPMAWSQRTNKPYCSAKCWLNEKPNQAPIQVASKKPVLSQHSSFYVAYAKDILVAMIDKIDKSLKPVEIEELMKAAVACVKIAMDEFK